MEEKKTKIPIISPPFPRLRAASLSFWTVEHNARERQLTMRVPPSFLASTLARACTPLTVSEEKARLLVVYPFPIYL